MTTAEHDAETRDRRWTSAYPGHRSIDYERRPDTCVGSCISTPIET